MLLINKMIEHNSDSAWRLLSLKTLSACFIASTLFVDGRTNQKHNKRISFNQLSTISWYFWLIDGLIDGFGDVVNTTCWEEKKCLWNTDEPHMKPAASFRGFTAELNSKRLRSVEHKETEAACVCVCVCSAARPSVWWGDNEALIQKHFSSLQVSAGASGKHFVFMCDPPGFKGLREEARRLKINQPQRSFTSDSHLKS